MTENILGKYKEEDSVSSGSSDGEVISKAKKQSPLSNYKKTPYPLDIPSYKRANDSRAEPNPRKDFQSDYGRERLSGKYSSASSPEKDPMSVLRSLGKHEHSFTQSSDSSSKNSEVTFQWNERTGSLTLVDNDTIQPRKVDEYVSNFTESSEGLVQNLIDRSNAIDSLIKELSKPNLNVSLFMSRFVREMSDVKIDLKEAQNRLMTLVKEKAAAKEQLAMHKGNVKKLMNGCKMLQDELKKYS
eukprot:TRINITY_DN10789_c0_g2_i3.p2 TRINITY_DN10789_c0_g2~~TRINITY_DN10789_c0_g2_i3.p2  ORF type:complete len:243 (-),score=61.79 TRINITY_DN10789_c0_g2_i3:954-1682(-)